MPEKVIDIPGVGPTAFPDSMTDAQINAASTRLYQNANVGKKQPPVTSWTEAPSDSGALAMKAGASAIPVASGAADAFFTSPNVAPMGAKIGRAVGAVTSLPGGLSGFGDVQKGAYAGGKSGWFTGKLLQDVAEPVAKGLEAAKPYAQAASTLSGAQGALDLAQMAEPKRQDIGVMGMGTQSNASDQAAVMKSQIANLVKTGTPVGEATRTVYNAWAKFLHEQQASK